MENRLLYVFFVLTSYVVQPILVYFFQYYSPYPKEIIDWIHLYFIVGISLFIIYTILGNDKFIFEGYHSIKIELSKSFSYFLIIVMIYVSITLLFMKVGITTYVDIEYFPYKLGGLLFYSRIFIFPVIGYLIVKKGDIVLNLLVYINLIIASFTSGSRLIAVFLTLSFLGLKSKFKILYFLIALISSVIISSLSRDLFLADWVQDHNKHMYAANHDEISVLYFIDMVASYLIVRIQGAHEFIHLMNTQICDDNWFNLYGKCKTAAQVYNIENGVGGVGFDLFGNIFFLCLGNYLYYFTFLILLSVGIKYLGRSTSYIGYYFSDKNITLILNIFILIMIFELRLTVLVMLMIFLQIFYYLIKSKNN